FCNILGYEGAAAATLFSLPGSRRQLIVGKNLAMFAAISVFNLIAVIAVASLARVLRYAPVAYLCAELSLIILIALGNYVSVLRPYPLWLAGGRPRQPSVGEGLTVGCMFWVLMLVYAGFLVPVTLSFVVPLW